MTNKWRKQQSETESETDSETGSEKGYEKGYETGSETESETAKSSKYETEDEPETVYESGSKSCIIPAYFCNPSAADMIKKVDQEVNSAKECQNICKQKENCKFFTFFQFRGFPSCYLLKSCNEKVRVVTILQTLRAYSEQKPVCTEKDTCVSGMMTCTVETPCPRLRLKRGDHSRWRCDGVNPYKEDIPSHVSCHTS